MTTTASGSTRREWLLALLAVTFMSFLVVGTYIPDQEPLSPFDEWVYLDYVDKLTRLGIPQTGETVDSEALEVSSCRGVFVWGPTGSPCGGPYVPAEYPMSGITSADVHPPTYFGANAALAGVVRSLGLSDDMLTSNRMIGALWLAVGLGLVVVLARLLGATMLASVGAAGVLASLPLTRYSNSYITPDALNVAIGAGILIVALRVSRGQWPWWTMIAVGGLAGIVKTQNGLAVGAAACFLVARVLIDRRRDPQEHSLRPVWGAVGAVIAFAAAQLGWIVMRRILSVGPIAEQGVEVPLTINLMLRETTAFVFRLGLGATEDGLEVPTHAYFSAALLVAGCMGAVLYRRVTDERWALAASLTLLVFLGSPILMIAEQVAVSEVIPSPTRYGASLLAGIAAMLATAFPGRRRSTALASLGALLVLVVVIDNLAR